MANTEADSTTACNLQTQSPLFSYIPPEIRNRIFDYALSDYEDSENGYAMTTCYRRPDCTASRRVCIALLCTCRRVHDETRARIFSAFTLNIWLAASGRRPPHIPKPPVFKPATQTSLKLYDKPIELAHVRVYAQLYKLEPGNELQRLFTAIDHVSLRAVTVTIRHTDWWFWENDERLHMRAQWLRTCHFPATVQEVSMELESLERKKEQIDSMAQQMIEKWRFVRQDGVVMEPLATTSVSRWSGRSTWENRRWIRDETRPEELDYYIKTVVWHPSTTVLPRRDDGRGGTRPIDLKPPCPDLHVSSDFFVLRGVTCLDTTLLEHAGVPSGASSDMAKAMISQWQARQAEVAAQRREERRLPHVANRAQRRAQSPSDTTPQS